MKNNKIKLPKNFFKQSRPPASNKDTFKDIVPIKWSKEITDGKKQAFVYLKEEKR